MPDDSPPPSTGHQRYTGSERRRIDRTPVAPLRMIGRARLRPEWARAHPALRAGEWYPVVDRNPNLLLAFEVRPPLPGYLFLDTGGKGVHAPTAHFEVEPDPWPFGS